MKRKTLITISFWIVLSGINFGFVTVFLPFDRAFLNVLTNLSFAVITFYINSLWGFNKYFREKNNWRFIVFSVILILLLSGGLSVVDYYLIKPAFPNEIYNYKPRIIIIFFRSFFWVFFFYLGGTIYMLQTSLQKKAIQARQISEEKLQTELKLLKAQINPHFLFNALNNIYSLSYLKSDAAPKSILQLSQMLRYVIEDCQQEHVSLAKEIEYIENYIDFQKMKSPGIKKVRFEHANVDSDLSLSPLLFIPFLENSFKYSKIEEEPGAFIDIVIETKDHVLAFSIINSLPEGLYSGKGAGTGIKNVSQRLQILYLEEHNLKISREKDRYEVKLELILR